MAQMIADVEGVVVGEGRKLLPGHWCYGRCGQSAGCATGD